jgi:predicted Fe-S protein YdhL (DUF1289 family)
LDDLKQKTEAVCRGHGQRREKIELWDGKTAERIVEVLKNLNNEYNKRDSENVKK